MALVSCVDVDGDGDGDGVLEYLVVPTKRVVNVN